MKILKKKHLDRLILNGYYHHELWKIGEKSDLPPVIRLEGPGPDDVILLAWADPTDHDRIFGITKIAGFVTMGEFSLANIEAAAKASGSVVVIDENWESDPFLSLADYVPQQKAKRKYVRRSPLPAV
jgi:hypothetical protein